MFRNLFKKITNRNSRVQEGSSIAHGHDCIAEAQEAWPQRYVCSLCGEIYPGSGEHTTMHGIPLTLDDPQDTWENATYRKIIRPMLDRSNREGFGR